MALLSDKIMRDLLIKQPFLKVAASSMLFAGKFAPYWKRFL